MEPQIRKRIIRRRVHRLRQRLDPESRRTAESRITRLILDLPEIEEAKAVLAYAPIRGEVDLAAVVETLRTRGLVIAYPRVEPEGELTIRPHAAGQPLEAGFRGIPEPSSPPMAWSDLDVALVPGVAFDRAGRRLGYGGGYFDRALGDFEGTKVGIAFSCQIVEEVPSEPHDVPMDLVVTEDGMFPTP